MALLDAERAAVSVCFGREPSQADLELLGDRRIWLIYREMVRNRLRGELRSALKRTLEAAGEERIDQAFELHLAQEPPRTRYFHSVVLAFAGVCERLWRADGEVPGYLADLVAYEAALWAVSDLPDSDGTTTVDFDFDKVAVVSPALRLLRVEYAVHNPADESGGYAAGVHHLCLHRAAAARQASTWSLNAVTFDIMKRLVDQGQTVVEAVKATATDRQFAVDETFLDGLTTVLADFIDRGVILGSREGT